MIKHNATDFGPREKAFALAVGEYLHARDEVARNDQTDMPDNEFDGLVARRDEALEVLAAAAPGNFDQFRQKAALAVDTVLAGFGDADFDPSILDALKADATRLHRAEAG